MKIYILPFVILLMTNFPLSSLAQKKLEAGLRINNSYFSNYRNSTETSSYADARVYDFQRFGMDMTLQVTRDIKKFIRLRFGYGIRGRKGQYSWETAGSTSYNSKSKSRQESFLIGVGVGRKLILNRLTFQYGLEGVFDYGTKETDDYLTESFDLNGVKTGSTEYSSNMPENFGFGAHVITSVHYRFWKGLNLTIELSNGFMRYVSKGTSETTAFKFDANGAITNSTSVTRSSETKKFANEFMRPSFGFQYSFGHKSAVQSKGS